MLELTAENLKNPPRKEEKTLRFLRKFSALGG